MGRFGKGGLFLGLFLDPGATVGEGGGWGCQRRDMAARLGPWLGQSEQILDGKIESLCESS